MASPASTKSKIRVVVASALAGIATVPVAWAIGSSPAAARR